MEHTSVSIETQKLTSTTARRSYRIKAIMGLLALAAVVATFAVFNYTPAVGTDVHTDSTTDSTNSTTDSTNSTTDSTTEPHPQDISCKWSDFDTWYGHHGHQKSAQEKANCFRIWCIKDSIHKEHNKGNHSYKLGHNHHSCHTDEEIRSQLFGAIHPDDAKSSSKLLLGAVPAVAGTIFPNIPIDVDWRAQGAVTAIKNQGSCGCCWTEAATATLEGFYAIHGHRLTNFSNQYFIDCFTDQSGVTPQTRLCTGGHSDQAMQYAINNGIPRLSDYPFTSVKGVATGVCSLTANTVKTGAQVMTQLPSNNPAYLIGALAQGPITVYIWAEIPTFMSYASGVFTDTSVDGTTSANQIDHAVTLVGYHLDTPISNNGTINLSTAETDLSGYYILRNSWNTTWGEDGYARVAISYQNNGAGLLNIHTSGMSLSAQ